MPDNPVPEEVQQFILQYIDSIAELEGLLLVCREREASWDAERLAARLYTTPDQAEGIFKHLYSLGFLSVEGNERSSYSYAPDSREKADAVERIAEVYSKYLVPVTNLIHSKPQTKVQQFADAFKLRNNPD